MKVSVLLDLLQKMAHDLRATLSPIYTDLLKKLLSLLPRSTSPPVLTCLLETLSSLFRYLVIPSLNLALQIGVDGSLSLCHSFIDLY